MEKRTKYFLVSLCLVLGLLVINQLRLQAIVPPKPVAVFAELPQATLKKEKLLIGAQTLEVEVATTTTELATGLSYREQLGSDGMLFVLPNREKVGFWMKGMKFNIDILWIRDNKIDEISPHVLASSYERNQQLFYPTREVDLVLELPADQAVALGLKVGDLVQFESNP